MEARKRSRQEWITLLDKMSKSPLTQTQWCRQRGINYKTMRAMKDKIKKASSPDASTKDTDVSTKPEPAFTFMRAVARKDAALPLPTQQPIELRVGTLIITIAIAP
jgi:hypothetical protein